MLSRPGAIAVVKAVSVYEAGQNCRYMYYIRWMQQSHMPSSLKALIGPTVMHPSSNLGWRCISAGRYRRGYRPRRA